MKGTIMRIKSILLVAAFLLLVMSACAKEVPVNGMGNKELDVTLYIGMQKDTVDELLGQSEARPGHSYMYYVQDADNWISVQYTASDQYAIALSTGGKGWRIQDESCKIGSDAEKLSSRFVLDESYVARDYYVAYYDKDLTYNIEPSEIRYRISAQIIEDSVQLITVRLV